MGSSINPSLIRDKLIFYLDVQNSKSTFTEPASYFDLLQLDEEVNYETFDTDGVNTTFTFSPAVTSKFNNVTAGTKLIGWEDLSSTLATFTVIDRSTITGNITGDNNFSYSSPYNITPGEGYIIVKSNLEYNGEPIGITTTSTTLNLTSFKDLIQGITLTSETPALCASHPNRYLKFYKDKYAIEQGTRTKNIFDQKNFTILLWVRNRDDNDNYDKTVPFFGQIALSNQLARSFFLENADKEIKGINGLYNLQSTEPKPNYINADNILVYWNTLENSWNIGFTNDPNEVYYKSFEDVNYPWQVSSWTALISTAIVTTPMPTLSVLNQNNAFRFTRFDASNNKEYRTNSVQGDKITSTGGSWNITYKTNFFFPTIFYKGNDIVSEPWDTLSWSSQVSSLSTHSNAGHNLAVNYFTLLDNSNFRVNSHGIKQIYRSENQFNDNRATTTASNRLITHISRPRTLNLLGNVILPTRFNKVYTQPSPSLQQFTASNERFIKNSSSEPWVIQTRLNNAALPWITWYIGSEITTWPWQVSSWTSKVTGWNIVAPSFSILNDNYYSDGETTGGTSGGFNLQTGLWNYLSVGSTNTKRVRYREVVGPANTFSYDLNYPPLNKQIFDINNALSDGVQTYRYNTTPNTYYEIARESGKWLIKSSNFTIYESQDNDAAAPFFVNNWVTTVTALSVSQPPAINTASFNRNFALNKTLNHGIGPDITFQRETLATFYDENGLLRNTPHNVLRNSEARESVIGILPDSNQSPSATGKLPKYWIFFRNISLNTDAGVLTEVLDTGNEDGLNYIDVRFYGTPTRTEHRFLGWEAPAPNDPFPLTSNSTLVAKGQTWTNSVYMRLQNGSLANTDIDTVIYGRNINNENMSQEITITRNNPGAGSLTDQRYFTTRTLTQSAVYNLYTGFRFSITANLPIDFTLRIAAPQVEQNITPSQYVPSIYTPTANQRFSFFNSNSLVASNMFINPVWGPVGNKPGDFNGELEFGNYNDGIGSSWKVALSTAKTTSSPTLSYAGFQQNLPPQPPGTFITNSIYLRRDLTDAYTLLPDVELGISEGNSVVIPSWRITWYWQRFFFTGPLEVGPGGLMLKYFNTNTTPITSVLYVANAQSEINNGPTPYLFTATASASRFVQVFNQRTNLLKQSNNFEDNAWYGYFAKAPELSKNATDPHGIPNNAWSIPLSAARYGFDPANPSKDISYHTGLIQVIDPLPVGTPITVSAWLKADDNSATYTFGANDCHMDNIILTNQWQRVSHTSYYLNEGTCTGPRGTQFVVLSGVNTNNASRVYVYGMQCEIGYNVTPYIPTTTTPVSSDITYLPNISQPRFDHGPTGESLGLLMEEPTTNNVPYSEDFTDSYWQKLNITVAPNASTAPDGSNTANAIFETSTATGFMMRNLQASPSRNGTNNWTSASIFAKANGRTKFSIQIGNLDSALFDLTNETATSIVEGVTTHMVSVGNGWYRCTATRYSTGNSLVQYTLRNDDVGVYPAGLVYTGDPAKGMYFWGAQVERSDYKPGYNDGYHERRISSSYVARHNYTGGNRAQEYATVAPAEFLGINEGTLYSSFKTGNFVGEVAAIAVLGQDIYPIPNRVGSFISGLQIAVNGTYNNIQFHTPQPNTHYKTIIGYKNNDNAASINGSAVTTSSTPVPENLYRLFIGGEDFKGPGAADSHIKEITYWPGRISNNELRSITTTDPNGSLFESNEFLLSDDTTRIYNDKPYWEEDASLGDNVRKLRVIFAGDPSPTINTVWGGIATAWYYGFYDQFSSNPMSISLAFSASNPEANYPWDVVEWVSMEAYSAYQPPTLVPIALQPPTTINRFTGLSGWVIESTATGNALIASAAAPTKEEYPWAPNINSWVNVAAGTTHDVTEGGLITENLTVTQNPEISAWYWQFGGSNVTAYSAESVETFPWDVPYALWQPNPASPYAALPVPQIIRPPELPIDVQPLDDEAYLNIDFSVTPLEGGSLIKKNNGLLGYKLENLEPKFSGSLGPLQSNSEEWYLVGLSMSGSSVKLYKNLNAQTYLETNTTFGLSSISIGTSNIDIGQVLVYNKPLTDTEIIKTYRWFKGRYHKDVQFVGPITEPQDLDALAYIEKNNITVLSAQKAINDFCSEIKANGIWDNIVCWPLRSSQMIPTGNTVYSLGGLGDYEGNIINGSTRQETGLGLVRLTSTQSQYISTNSPSITGGDPRSLFVVTNNSNAFGFYCGEGINSTGQAFSLKNTFGNPSTIAIDFWFLVSAPALTTNKALGGTLTNKIYTVWTPVNYIQDVNENIIGTAPSVFYINRANEGHSGEGQTNNYAFVLKANTNFTKSQFDLVYSIYKRTLGQGLVLT